MLRRDETPATSQLMTLTYFFFSLSLDNLILLLPEAPEANDNKATPSSAYALGWRLSYKATHFKWPLLVTVGALLLNML